MEAMIPKPPDSCMYGKILANDFLSLKREIARSLEAINRKLDNFNESHTNLRLDVHQLKILTQSNAKEIELGKIKHDNFVNEIKCDFDGVREDTLSTKLKQNENSTTTKIMWGIGGTVLLLVINIISALIINFFKG